MTNPISLTLLTTKLHQPHVTRDLVARPRLWERLERGLGGSVISVSAGAGYGKTTLISSWLEGLVAGRGGVTPPLQTAWLSLDEYDSALDIFVRYFVAALRTIFPGACPDTLALLQAPQQPPLAALIATLSVLLDDRQEWYRYHHLLQDLLRQRASAALGPDQMNELHGRAAAWFAQWGFVEEAIQHAVAAHDLDQAARLMEQGSCQVLNREDRPTLERWLSLLPEDFLQRRPGLLMITAWVLTLSWRLGELSKLLDRVETLIERDAGPLSAEDLRILRGQIMMLRGQEAYFSNQTTRSIACAQEALALLPKSWTYGRGSCMLYLGTSMQASGQGSAADRFLRAQYESWHTKSDTYAVRILFALCVNAIQAGQLEQARQTGGLMLQ